MAGRYNPALLTFLAPDDRPWLPPMLPEIQVLIRQVLQASIAQVVPDATPVIILERPKNAAHGDLATNVAMQLAKPARRNPRELAQAIIDALHQNEAARTVLAGAELAGPGFINLRLQPAAHQRVVPLALTSGPDFGRGEAGNGAPVLVEFVSANPTGPLHTGHTRQACLGDAICNLLQAQGWAVSREFYYNDAGVQIGTLAASVQARLLGYKPGDAQWPESAYNGDYIADVAADFAAQKTVHADDREFTASGDPSDLEGIRQFAVAYLRREQDLDLQALGVRFDQYYLESSLYTDGRVESTVQRLIAAGKTYEQDGALWLRSTDYGDDKDRVMRKSDGTYTYFVPDVAYHLAKFERGFTKAINIQGGDHHGTIARVRAGIQAAGMGVPSGYPDYVLHKMVTVMKGGEEVKISKRAGSYVTLRDLVDWTGRDAVRFFMLSRKADTEFVFDVDLAVKQNDENPVYYCQYAHARMTSILTAWADKEGGETATLPGGDVSALVAPKEIALMQRLAEFPDVVAQAADELAPHHIAFYARELAADFHSFYNAERVLVEDPTLKRARLALVASARQVMANALRLLGVRAPDKM